MRFFELSEKLYVYFYVLQSVEILLSGTVVSDGFTHRPWPRAFGARATPSYGNSLLKFPTLWRPITSQFTLKRAKMQTASLDYQCSNNTIILFATQYKNYNIAFHRSSAVSGALALLQAFCQWTIAHQISAVSKVWYWGTWLGAREMQAVCMKVVTSSSVVSPNFLGGQILWLTVKRATVFYLDIACQSTK